MQHEFTPEELQAAYLAIREPHWPDLPAVLTDPLRARLVRFTAWRLANGLPVGRITHRREPITRPAAPFPVPTHPPAQRDHKRAAAGDTDD